MISVNGTTITMTRGDTVRIQIGIKDGNNDYTPQEGDVIQFTAKRYLNATSAAISKTIPNNTLILAFEPSDTNKLPYGSYLYDIQLTYANGDVDTFISGSLVLLGEVTT